MIGNKSDCGGLALARDVCEFFDAEVPDREVVTPPAEPTVVLSDGDRRLKVPAELFDALFGVTFGEIDVRMRDGRLADVGVDKLVSTARRLGFAKVGERLERFRATLKGMPFVRRGDGSPWQPAPVSALKVVKPEDYEREATSAGLVADVSEFFKGE